MSGGNWLVTGATLLTPFLLAGLTWVQWRTTEQNIERRKAEEHRNETRKRDVELLHWGNAVIACLSRLEILCERWAEHRDNLQASNLAAEASALVDQGRLFFPNVDAELKIDQELARTRNSGLRVAILDEVVRGYLVSKFAASDAGQDTAGLASKVQAARRRFVVHLQKEMGESLSRSAREKAGQSIPRDPRTW